jgi:hypothetical protein
MRIDDIRPESTRPDTTRPAAPVTGPTRSRAINPGVRERSDQVEISPEARALAAQHDVAAQGGAGVLSPERVAELRRWIQSGGFDTPEVTDTVARRLLSSREI